MNLDFIYNDLKADRKVFEKNYEFMLNQDIIVPDSKPDILEILHKSSNICIERQEIVDNRLKINGILYVDVMYMADNETNDIRALNTEIELNQTINIDDNYSNIIPRVYATVNGIECKITNERKIGVTANIDCNAVLESNENINYIESIRDGNEDMQVLNSKLPVSRIIGNEVQNISISEEVSVSNLEIFEILETDVRIINEEYKISYNKVLVKADAVINIVYVTQNNNICTQEVILPFTGFVDMAGITDNNIIDINFDIKNRSVKLNDNKEDRKFSINMEIGANIKSYENSEITIIEDMYSLTRGIGFDKCKIGNDTLVCLDNIFHEVKESIKFDEVDCKVIGISSKITKSKIERVNDKLHIDGEISLEIMCRDLNRIFIKNYQVPFTYIYDNQRIKSANLYCLDTSIRNITYTVVNNCVDICVQIKMKISIKNKMDFNIIANVREEDNRILSPYSITIYYVKPNDSLWSIAKMFGTTVEEIAKYNDIDNPDEEILQIGRQLFIPQKIVKSVV